MSRYVMNWGGEVEFNAHDEFEIFEIIKRSLRINPQISDAPFFLFEYFFP